MMKLKRKAEVNYQDEIREILVCKYCTYETENIDDLDNHILTHDQKSQDLEEECEDIIVLVNDMPSKKRVKPNVPETYSCPYCKYVTKRKHDLPKHLLTHCTPETTTIYRCSQCPYETKRKNDMPKHMLAHCTDVVTERETTIQKYKCLNAQIVHIKLKEKSDLPKHLLCHKPCEEVPLYKCDYCVYVTKRKGDLPKHILNHKEHADIKLFSCSECDYKTKRKNDLHKHMLVHCDRHVAGVFKCLKCTYATDKVNKFSKHVLSECRYYDDAITLEHLMLEDIIASVEDENIQFIGDNEEGEDCDDQNEYSEEYTEERGAEDEQQTYNEYLQYGVSEEASRKKYRAEVNRRHGVFNINLGEFSMDVASQDMQSQEGNEVQTYIKEEYIQEEDSEDES
ncbi:hypothetical protein NQ314_011260 [Rhamnusium bicolor]|uniref:C2H2-type domain-containing protein n=1 Tax=Rhamnusium bicolor TaxID=1586634 RepID=A0AAV8XKB7_9CUCU|nr:hypothetical protein NQ314_011260 [Rhamnusium bicolor]